MSPKLEKRVRTARGLLTFVALVLFMGPMLRDTNDSHLLNHLWTGHARFHFMWALGFMFSSGIANFYYLWLKRPLDLPILYLCCAWQACSLLGGFWLAVFTRSLFGGDILEDGFHVMVMGINENVLIFGVLAAILVGTYVFVRFRIDGAMKAEGAAASR